MVSIGNPCLKNKVRFTIKRHHASTIIQKCLVKCNGHLSSNAHPESRSHPEKSAGNSHATYDPLIYFGDAFAASGTEITGWSSITGLLGAGFVDSGVETETGMGIGPALSVPVSSFGAISGISLGFNAS